MAVLMLFMGAGAYAGYMIAASADFGTTGQIVSAVTGSLFGLAILIGD